MSSGYVIVKAGSEDFDWDSYLMETGASPAPPECFYQSPEPPENLFEESMKLEANDPRCPINICLATVVQSNGPRIRLRLDGADRCNDYWVMVDCSANIHPIGYCQEKNSFLLPPFGCTESSEKFARLLKTTLRTCRRAPIEAFKSPPKEKPSENLFRPGMKLEAVDVKHPYLISPATVKEVNEEMIKIAFDGWGDKYDLSCRFDSRDIFPVGWCKKTGHPIQIPPKKIPSSKSDFGGSDTASERGLTPNRTPTPGLGRNGRSDSPAEVLIVDDARRLHTADKDESSSSSPKIASVSSGVDQVWSSFSSAAGATSMIEIGAAPAVLSSATKRDQFGEPVNREAGLGSTSKQFIGLQSAYSKKSGGSSSSAHTRSPSPFSQRVGGGVSEDDQPLAKLFATESSLGSPVCDKNSGVGIHRKSDIIGGANGSVIGINNATGGFKLNLNSGSTTLSATVPDNNRRFGNAADFVAVSERNGVTLTNTANISQNSAISTASELSSFPNPGASVVASVSRISENLQNFNNNSSFATSNDSNSQEIQEISSLNTSNNGGNRTSSPSKQREKSFKALGSAKGGAKPLSKKASPGSSRSPTKGNVAEATEFQSNCPASNDLGEASIAKANSLKSDNLSSTGGSKKAGGGRKTSNLGPPGWNSPGRKQRPDIVVSVDTVKDMVDFMIYINPRCRLGSVLDQYKVDFLPPSLGPGSINNLFREALQLLINAAADPKKVFNQISPNDGHYLVTADFDGTTNGRHLPFVVNAKETWVFLRHVLGNIGACPNFYSPVAGCSECGTFEKPKRSPTVGFNTGSYVVDLSRYQEDSPDDWHSEAVRWSVDEVVDFVSRQDDPSIAAQAELFRTSEIDGKALVLLNSEMIIKYMDVKLGPALKIAHTIDRLRGIHHSF